MASHQMKKLKRDDLMLFRDRLQLPISDADLQETAPYYHPGPDSEEIRYLQERRRELGGYVPERRGGRAKPLVLPAEKAYDGLRRGSGKQAVATTMAVVRLLKDLMKDKEIGHRFVPVIPDEARTFGLDAIFPTAKIYSPHGQTYDSVDRELLLSYKESKTGQILHEGITEAGSMASVTAAGTAYATHGEPMIPFYIFYSMFGFQRTGDAAWAFSDMLGRGFLLGATAGRTTLNGEGLQHEDGHSLLLAATNPAVVAYDPAFGFEVAHVFRDGLRRMYGEASEDVWYYLTVYNEPYQQPAEPEGARRRRAAEGAVPVRAGRRPGRPAAGAGARLGRRHDLGAGGAAPARRGVGRRGRRLVGDVLDRAGPRGDGVRARQPARAGRRAARAVRPAGPRRAGPVRWWPSATGCAAVPDQIAPWVPGDWSALGHRRLRPVGHP